MLIKVSMYKYKYIYIGTDTYSHTHTHTEPEWLSQYSDWLRVERSGFSSSILGAGQEFSLHHRIQTGSEANPASYPVGTGVLSPEVKRPWREADHSPPSSAKVKNAWRYTSTPNTFSWRGA
jgi:hypothetical protein